MAAAKNFSLSPAAQDLGLNFSDALQDQQADEIEERKKKALAMRAGKALMGPGTAADQLLGPGSLGLT